MIMKKPDETVLLAVLSVLALPVLNHAHTYLGCYNDRGNRAMKGLQRKGDRTMTTEKCTSMCKVRGYRYAGTENSNECFCGNSYWKHGKAAETHCSKRCAGNNAQRCGGNWKLSVYDMQPAARNYLGCYNDKGDRAVKGFQKKGDRTMTTQKCIAMCKVRGFRYAGTEYENECFCGNSYGKHGKAAESHCWKRCAGNHAQRCGGTWKMSMYSVQQRVLDYRGCYNDEGNRAMKGFQKKGDQTMTTEKCISMCKAREFRFAGLQYSNECFCGNSYARHGKANEGQCSKRCAGNRVQFCGGTWKMSVYGVKPAAVSYLGCYNDKGDRAMKGFEKKGDKTMTTEKCIWLCKSRGFKYAGTQYSYECFCGNSYRKHGKSNESQCTKRCAGNHAQWCGGTWKMSVYEIYSKVDGGWNNWSKWSVCTKPCGGGIRKQIRTCTNPKPSHGGRYCHGGSTRSSGCNTMACAVDGGWNNWSKWSVCTKPCGGGIRKQIRTCTNPKPSHGGRYCHGGSTRSSRCNTMACAVDGGWNNWSKWSVCTKPCGGGIRKQIRTCTNPKPSHGGRYCHGGSTRSSGCNAMACAVDGSWNNWSKWSVCTKPCGGGIRKQIRTCTNPKPSHGGRYCHGGSTRSSRCNTMACAEAQLRPQKVNLNKEAKREAHYISDYEMPYPYTRRGQTLSISIQIDPPFEKGDGSIVLKSVTVGSDWGQWSLCDKQCGKGTKTQTGTCTNPSPSNGGKVCDGEGTMSESCNMAPCAVDGSWSDWGQWSLCDKQCGEGTKTQTRTCTNPSPSNGGKDCDGEGTRSESCNMAPCAVDGGWSDWGEWSHCDMRCGGGTRTRFRTCSDPSPSNDGRDCDGSESESESCNTHSCDACREVKCRSKRGDFNVCQLPSRKRPKSVKVLETYNYAKCSMYDTCGVEEDMLWVDLWCSALFEICYDN